MFLLFKKLKTFSTLIIILVILTVSLPINLIYAQQVNPSVSVGSPPGIGIFPVMDGPTEVNTNLLLLNTWSIANVLAGNLPGAEMDKVNPAAPSNLLKLAVKRILRQLTQSIVTWIDSGFNGGPSFITDTGQFLRDTADITIGDFLLNDPALSFLCDPFKLQIKLALGLQYRPFKDEIQCSLTGALKNVNNAMNDFLNGDFINGGGWDSWLQITTVPQNNQMGAMMLAQGELDARIEASKNNAVLEANWGGGFMSWKKCEPKTGAASSTVTGIAGDSNQTCTIETPGSTIANKIDWADTSTIRELELADDINAIFNALLNQLITRGMDIMSNSGLLGSGSTKPDTSYQATQAYLASLQAQINNQGSGPGAINGGGGSNVNAGYYNQNGSINFSQSFNTRADALGAINLQIATENQYAAEQNSIAQLLTAVLNTINSSTCNSTIKTSATNQITGNYTGVKYLPWNERDISLATTTTAYNLSILSQVKTAVSSAANDSAVPGLFQPLTSLNTLHSASDAIDYSTNGTAFGNIKNWVITEINTASASCSIDKSGLATWGIQ